MLELNKFVPTIKKSNPTRLKCTVFVVLVGDPRSNGYIACVFKCFCMFCVLYIVRWMSDGFRDA